MNAAIINLPAACCAGAWRQRIVTAAATTTPVNLTTVSISAIRQYEGLATATTSAAHGFLAGDSVLISGATPTAYNGHVTIETVPSTTTFTYRVDAKIANAATGTLVGVGQLWYRKALFVGLKAARTANTGTVYLGLGSTDDSQPLPITTGAERTLEAVTGARLNLADLWLDVATAADGVVILWH